MKFDIKKYAAPVAGVGIGYLGGNMVKPMIPLDDPKFKNGILAAGGLFVAAMGKGKLNLITGVGMGLAANGIVGILEPMLNKDTTEPPIKGYAQINGNGREYLRIDAEPSYSKPAYGGSAQIAGDIYASNGMY